MSGPGAALAGLAPLAPLALPDLLGLAALQTRTDRKYLLPVAALVPLLGDLAPGTGALEIDGRRQFTYLTVYFDTPELTSYRLTAHRRRHRFKVRTRTYVDSNQCWLEVKVPGARGRTVKHRLPYRAELRGAVAPGRAFVEDVLRSYRTGLAPGAELLPTLVTGYQRSTLYLPATASRVTIDTGLGWYDAARDRHWPAPAPATAQPAAGRAPDGRAPDGRAPDGAGRRLCLPGLAIVETKTAATPSEMDRLLWRLGHRPIRISKYATGLAALHPQLPAARWRRVLRRHFTNACADPAGVAHLATDQPGRR